MDRPNARDVRAFLRSHQALIVHFSGTPAPREFEIYYPDDLRRVIAGGAQTGLSCSVVKPGDNFDHAHGSRNAYGSIGVVIDLKTSESLRAVHVGDGGSLVQDGIRIFDERPIDLALLEKSITGRGEANEWGLRDYRPVGIFVAEPIEFWSPPNTIARTTIDSVLKTFPDQLLYTFEAGKIVKFMPDGSTCVVDPIELYPSAQDDPNSS